MKALIFGAGFIGTRLHQGIQNSILYPHKIGRLVELQNILNQP